MPAEPEISEAGLKFIRDEVLKLMVASIATAKAETFGAIELSNKARLHSIAMLNAGSNHGAICVALSIAVALCERGVLDPKDAIRWSEWMAANMPPASEPVMNELAARMLRNFAKIFASVMEVPPERPIGAKLTRTDGDAAPARPPSHSARGQGKPLASFPRPASPRR